MAQETAGTIGIPVIKNEVLPYVVDYAKRRQRAEELDARRKQQEALAAAKKEEQLASAFKMQTGRGRLFGHLDDAENTKDIQEGVNIFKSGAGSAADRIMTANVLQNRLNQRKSLSEGLDKDYEQTLKGLENSYVRMDYPTMQAWASQQTSYKPAQEFSESVKNDPRFVNLDKIGETAKNYGTYEYKFRDAKGNERSVTQSPLFEYKMEKDPVLGIETPKVAGVKADVAQAIIERDPEMQRAASVWIKQRKQDLTKLNPTADPVQIEDRATQDFMDTAFRKFGEIKYGTSAPMPTRAGAKGGRAPGAAVTATGPSSVVVKTYKTVKPQGTSDYPEFSTQQVKIGSDNDRQYTFKKEYTLDKNKAVVLLQPQDKSFNDIVERNPNNGRFTLKQNIRFSNATERIVNTLDEDYISQQGTKNEQLIKAGTPVSDDFYKAVMSGSYKGGRRPKMSKSFGYEIAGTVYDAKNNPIKSISIFVPESQAGTIKNAIELGEAEETSENPWDK